MNFGGPVWHASACAAADPIAWALAGRALLGVGDASAGEWCERGSRKGIVHIRRRLSEEESTQVNSVRDIRGTPEEYERRRALFADVPPLRALSVFLP